MLFEVAGGNGSRDGDDQRFFADFGSDFFKNFGDYLRLYAEDDNVRAFDRFAIVVGDEYTEFLAERKRLLTVLDGGGDALWRKQALLQISPKQNATEFAGAKYGEFFVGKFESHVG